MRVLSIDPALRNSGYAVIEQTDTKPGPQGNYRALAYGVISNPKSLVQSQCLVRIRSQLSGLIEEYAPEVCAIESVIYVQSYKTAIVLGAARGAALLAAAEKDLPIHEYPPKRVKQAVVGRGAASKEQVAFMMRALLGLTENPPSDAADALAIGMAHFYTAGTGTMLGNQVPSI